MDGYLGLHPTEEQLAALIPSSQTDKLTFPMFVNLVAESIAENSFLTEQLVEAFQTFSYNNPSSPARLDTLLKDFKKWSKSTDEQVSRVEPTWNQSCLM